MIIYFQIDLALQLSMLDHVLDATLLWFCSAVDQTESFHTVKHQAVDQVQTNTNDAHPLNIFTSVKR